MTSAETGFADLRVLFMLSANPAYSPILFRVVASLIEVVRMRPDLLYLFESYTASRILS
jgi:hypothetical protein